MDEISCPRCKTTNYRDPSLQLKVNSCGHGLCANCVDLIFAKGSGNCPTCNVPLRKGGFRFQYFQDAGVEKEVDIRRRILKDYCKRQDDFDSLSDYNNYLEEVEGIIYNLTHEIDVEETKRKIEKYKKANEDSIGRGKKSKDEQELEDLIEEEKELESLRRNRSLFAENEELNRAKAKQKEALVDELMFSDRRAEDIVAMHSDIVGQELASRQAEKQEEEKQQVTKAKSRFTSGLDSSIFIPLREEPEGQLAELLRLDEEHSHPQGPNCPAFDELEPLGYTRHVRAAEAAEIAAGFSSLLPCYRALQEGFNSLYYTSS